MNASSTYLHFYGLRSYVEIPDSPDFSVPTTDALTVSAWIRPEVLTFPSTENGYVHWLGKGQSGQHEWVFRMYSGDNTEGRDNRISFYVFNPDGGLGVGSYFQDPNNPVQAGVWLHVVGAADSQSTYIYVNGSLKDTDVYQGTIQPHHGTSPVRIGTRDLHSYFQGEIRQVRFWNRLLGPDEVASLYSSDTVPRPGLVAEYLLTEDVAPDTAGNHSGSINQATWIVQGG